ncbi:MAG: RDD family protein [bacterium]|nr:RDD family protein [bacterium]
MEDINNQTTLNQDKPIEEKPAQLISGFWQRLAALIIDGIILGIIGFIIGTLFYDFFAELGGLGRLIGFVIALLYFGTLNSSIGNGQTIGKRIMKIKVVDKNASTISFFRSNTRYTILGVPYFLNMALLPPWALFSFVSYLIGAIVFLGGGTIIYLYVFNRKTRQSLHDIVIGTFVIKTSPIDKVTFPIYWKGHLVIVGILCAVIFGTLYFEFPKLLNKTPIPEMLSLQKSIYESGLVHSSNAIVYSSSFKIWNYKKPNFGSEDNKRKKTTSISIEAFLKKKPDNYQVIIDKIALIVLNKFPTIMGKDLLSVTVIYGYDIGISSAWKKEFNSYPLGKWKERLSN